MRNAPRSAHAMRGLHSNAALSVVKRLNLLTVFAVALGVPAVAMLLHELGHFTAHAAFGYEVNRLTYASVLSGDPPPGVDHAFADGLSFAAGATVSLLLVGLAVGASMLLGPHPLILAVVLFEVVRGLLGLVLRVASAGLADTFAGGFGELRHLGRAFGAPGVVGMALSWIEIGIPVAALWVILRRLPSPERAWWPLAAFLGLLSGLALWVLAIGPWLLPP